MQSLLKIVVLVLFCTLTSGFQRTALRLMGSAILGDVLSTIPTGMQCFGSGMNFTSFMYFSRTHPVKHKNLVPGNKKLLRDSGFDPALPTKVMIHGFIDSLYLSDWTLKMKNKFLTTGEYNVIIVDWSCGNDFPYVKAISNSKVTAKALADLIKFLGDETGAEPSQFHLIGHSLGTHIAGRAGHLTPNLGRISALDPASPRFDKAALEDRLDRSDAKFVDAIHTDAGHSFTEGMSFMTNIGHVDFYPNGGRDQPGCHSSPLTVLPRVGLHRIFRYYVTCDHYRSVDFYIESIQPIEPNLSGEPECRPIGVACSDWETYSQGRCADCFRNGNCVQMGYFSDQFWNQDVSKNKYFLKTADDEPFCLFQYQVVVETGCEHGFCNDESSKSGFIPDVIRIELDSNSGKTNRLDLHNKEKELKPGGQYVYLATSRSLVGIVQKARIWWDSKSEPDVPAALNTPSGFSVKKIEIVPIELPEKLKNLAVPQVIVLCGLPDEIIGSNQYLELTVNAC